VIKLKADKKQETTESVNDHTGERQFSKEQIAVSERYRNHRDLVEALLDERKKYTFENVDHMIEKYKKGQVK